MKALTICQPYASLILGWDGMPFEVLKRVENRRWATSYRGSLLIHAGSSTRWLRTWDGPVPDLLPMGVILGQVELVGCYSTEHIGRIPDRSPLAWLKHDMHASGPFCLLLRRPRRLRCPIRHGGRQGLFDVPDEVLTNARWFPKCHVCGCTDLDGCPQQGAGCHWVQPDLCSACAGDSK